MHTWRAEHPGEGLIALAILTAAASIPLWAMTPLDMFDRFGQAKYQVMMLLAATTVLLFLVRGVARRTFDVPAGTALVMLGLLVLQSAVAALVSTDPVLGVMGNRVRYDGFLMIIANAALFLLAFDAFARGGRATLEAVAGGAAAASIPVFLYAFVQSAGLDPIVWEVSRAGSQRAFSTLGNPIFLGAYCAMALTLALGLGLRAKGFSSWLWVIVAGGNAAAVVFSATRAAWIAAGAGIALMLVFAIAAGVPSRFIFRLAAVIGMAMAMVALGLMLNSGRPIVALQDSVATIADPGASRNSGRIEIWSIAARMVRDHPVTGVGPDEMGKSFPAYRTAAFDRAEGVDRVADKPHSSVLQWAVETGLPGALLFLSVCGLALVGGIRRLLADRPSVDAAVAASVWAAVAVYFAQSLITVTAIGVNGVWWMLLGLVAAMGARVDLRRRSWFEPATVKRVRPTRGWRVPRASFGQAGFTLIELLVVIIIIAILAAIAIPTYLGQRGKAQDAAAVTLVRNALTIVQSVQIDKRYYTLMTAADLNSMEPTVTWRLAAGNLVDPSIPAITGIVTAQAGNREMDFFPQSADVFDLATTSGSGNQYGIQVQTSGAAGASYVKVKQIEGVTVTGW